MKNNFIIVTILLVCLGISLPVICKAAVQNKKAMSNTFENPDFAFPRTVINNADVKLQSCLQEIDKQVVSDAAPYVTGIKAVMQMCVANSSISTDSAILTNIQLVDSTANIFEKKKGFGLTAASVCRLLEAGLYQGYYSQNRWTFNNRGKQPVLSANPAEWGRGNFADKIVSLIKAAFNTEYPGSDTPLSEFAAILNSDSSIKGLTVYDFITLKAVSLLSDFSSTSNIIPFGDSAPASMADVSNPDGLKKVLLERVLDFQQNHGYNASVISFVNDAADLPHADKRKEYLQKWMDNLIDTPYCADIISNLYHASRNSEASATSEEVEKIRKRFFEIISGYLEKQPDCYSKSELNMLLSSICRKSVDLNYPNLLTSASELKVKCDSKNLNEYYVLIFKVKNGSNDYIKTDMIAGQTPVKAHKVAISGSVPFAHSDTVSLGQLPVGTYVMAVSSNPCYGGIADITSDKSLRTLRVSDISMTVSGSNGAKGVYVVDASTQRPLKGVVVEKRSTEWRQRGKSLGSVVTDDKGFAAVDNEGCELVARHKGSEISSYYYNYGKNYSSDITYSAQILTDLSIYHPGDSVGFVAVVWKSENNKMKADARRKCTVRLFNANQQVVDSLELTTDEFGRVAGKFVLPKKGLTGEWAVALQHNDGRQLCWKPLQVSDYKAPTFYVEIDSVGNGYQPGDTVILTGKASTYSGMPVSGAKVAVTVDYLSFFSWYTGNNATYGLETTTDAAGKFIIKLATRGLINTPYANGAFAVTAAVTSAQGETQTNPRTMFSLGKGCRILPQIPAKAAIEKDPLVCDVKVVDMLEKPVSLQLKYEIENKRDGEIVMSGDFESPGFILDSKQLGAGEYSIRFTPADSTITADVVVQDVIIYDKQSKTLPYETSLWVPETSVVATPGSKYVKVYAGTSYKDDYLLVVVADDKKVVETYWLEPSAYMHELNIIAPEVDGRIHVTIQSLHDFNSKRETITVIPAEQLEKMTVRAESFRDKLLPGSHERWTFRFSTDKGRTAVTPAMAVMSNKALNALEPFNWILNPASSLYWPNVISLTTPDAYTINKEFGRSISGNVKGKHYVEPDWIYNFTTRNRYYSVRIRGSRSGVTAGGSKELAVEDECVMAAMPAANDMSAKLAKVESAADSEGEISGTANGGNGNEESIRDVECPLAFFKPLLLSDEKGEVALEFDVPDFNTTWQMQLAGYDSKMRGSVLKLDAVASKPVMISVNMPRFLRSGDKAIVAATIFNNSSHDVDVRSELSASDAASSEKIEDSTEKMTIAPMQCRTVYLEFAVPSDCNVIYIKGVAGDDNYTDGEGSAVMVLPSSQPVIESTPIYISRGETVYEQRIQMSDGGNLTLKYCNNPVWTCVTALPDLAHQKSDNIFSAVVNLYGNAVSSGIVRKYSQIGDALKLFSTEQQETLTSPLSQNENLKAVALENTPWVNDALSETQRMMQLVDLTDADKCKEAIESCVDKIVKRQNPDGSWSWFDTMPPSRFITEGNVLILGELGNLGYLPAALESPLSKAVKFCDAEWVKDSNRKYFNPSSMLDYLYARGHVKEKMTPAFAALTKKALSAIKNDWRGMNIHGKATAAYVLASNGYTMEARTVLESLRQFASVSAEKGMWWDNLSSGWQGAYSLLTTSRVLESWYAIDPDAPEIDAVRQWLLMSKQSQNWGDNRFMSEVISTLLTTGSDWISDDTPAEITIDGKPLAVSKVAQLTGEVVADIPCNSESMLLRIDKRSEAPAWGGVINQYVEDIDKIKAVSNPQVSIVKSIEKVSETADGKVYSVTEKYKVGDKIRVKLLITNDRDLDYVTVSDSRGACMEPVEQLSEYTAADGILMYKEVRNTTTNLFFSFLPKGKHVITYECYIDRAGVYTAGIAELQSQYAPELTAHSAGEVIVAVE